MDAHRRKQGKLSPKRQKKWKVCFIEQATIPHRRVLIIRKHSTTRTASNAQICKVHVTIFTTCVQNISIYGVPVKVTLRCFINLFKTSVNIEYKLNVNCGPISNSFTVVISDELPKKLEYNLSLCLESVAALPCDIDMFNYTTLQQSFNDRGKFGYLLTMNIYQICKVLVTVFTTCLQNISHQHPHAFFDSCMPVVH